MKINNFRIVKEELDLLGRKIVVAEVDVTTGFLFWKKTQTRTVMKGPSSYSWFFTDDGEWTPDLVMDRLFRAYKAKVYEVK